MSRHCCCFAVAALLACATACNTGGTPCVPNCPAGACGDDGCGGSCGTCASGQTCSASGQCVGACTPKCPAGACGDDGCGGSCGTCPPACTPSCSNAYDCGKRSDGCGGTCRAAYEPPFGHYVGSAGDLLLSGSSSAVKSAGSLAPRDRSGWTGTGTLIDNQLHIFQLDPICCFMVLDATLDRSTGVLTGETCFGTSNAGMPPYKKTNCKAFTLTYDPTCD